MKKVLFFILFFCACLQTNAQKVYNEEGKYYEFAYVWYRAGSTEPGIAYMISPSKNNKWYDNEYTDDNGKKIVFNNYMACINYFMAKGWSVIDILKGDKPGELHFYVRKEITKEQAEKLAQDCIKELK